MKGDETEFRVSNKLPPVIRGANPPGRHRPFIISPYNETGSHENAGET